MPTAIMIAVSLWGSPLCRWPWWMYHVYCGFLRILRSVSYRRAFIEFIEESTGVSLCTFVVYGGLCWHCHCHCVSCCEGKSNCYLGFLSNVCALVVVSCEEIMMVCRVVLNPGLLLRRCLSYLHVKIYVGFRILISLSHCY